MRSRATCHVCVQVLEPPSWIIKPFDVEGVEADKVEFKCQALGVPPPSYSWVDRDGLDVSQRQGEDLIKRIRSKILKTLKNVQELKWTSRRAR